VTIWLYKIICYLFLYSEELLTPDKNGGLGNKIVAEVLGMKVFRVKLAFSIAKVHLKIPSFIINARQWIVF
jgi:hypothetical protein